MTIMNRVTRLSMIIVMLLCLTSCWSRNELTELAIVSGMAIDKEDEEYLLTVQVVNPGEIAGKTFSSRLPVTTYKATGRSIFESLRKISKESAKRLYFSHLRMVVISEEQAKSGISKILDLMSRDHEFRTDFYTVISKDVKASDTLNILTAIEKNPANKVFTSLEISHSYWAPTLGVKLDNLISELTQQGDNPVLTGIIVKGNKEIGKTLSNVEKTETPASLIIDHFAVFKGDKLVGWLNEDESKGHNYITDKVESTVAVVDWEDGNITFEVRDTQTKVDAVIEDSKPKIQVKVTTEVNVGEVQAKIDLLNENIIEQLEEELNRNKVSKMNQAVEKAKELKTDIFGFGEVIHREDPKLWNQIKDKWNDEGFVNLTVDIKSDTNIRRLGSTNEPFLNEIQGGK
ncbi:Ger(x)C family spore germination protein [Bacillus luteolus]|uniref:Ger(X)C family spore germination protein n=1 Tax=Litchfieldia luteola TaxID=682179 RepID=A0ABR9QGG9_9BACI|nr:Ger(x)C family spore germination protein [Cytobacillus luteolus]MBE4907334.1 Ger(x)C family spore germination protein [Cytobacillus luteolus]MBP1943881.1 spore germination protein KC [Cytobacillus luteolus]